MSVQMPSASVVRSTACLGGQSSDRGKCGTALDTGLAFACAFGTPALGMTGAMTGADVDAAAGTSGEGVSGTSRIMEALSLMTSL